MTGFGKASSETSARRLTVEIKSLNSKQLDLQLRMPSELKETDMELRSIIAAELLRGKVEAWITFENEDGHGAAVINRSVIANYRKQITEVAAELMVSEPHDWMSVLLRMPDVYTSEANVYDEDMKESVIATCREALVNLNTFRSTEGERLETFFRQKIANISALLDAVEPYEAERVPKIKSRLEEQLAKISTDYNRERLEQELIFYLEKLDITEEKTRLRSHLTYFISTLDEAPGQGKKLGFIAQEIGREINTLGSKANDAGMQQIVVKMKDELEQIKEQVLNVL